MGKLVKGAYVKIKPLIHEARESKEANYTIGYKAALEDIKKQRKMIASRRLAAELNRPIHSIETAKHALKGETLLKSGDKEQAAEHAKLAGTDWDESKHPRDKDGKFRTDAKPKSMWKVEGLKGGYDKSAESEQASVATLHEALSNAHVALQKAQEILATGKGSASFDVKRSMTEPYNKLKEAIERGRTTHGVSMAPRLPEYNKEHVFSKARSLHEYHGKLLEKAETMRHALVNTTIGSAVAEGVKFALEESTKQKAERENGSSEWDEAKHPRDKDGKFT